MRIHSKITYWFKHLLLHWKNLRWTWAKWHFPHASPHLLLLELVASHPGHRESPARPAASGARRSPPRTRPLAPPQWTEASWSTSDTFRGYRGTSDLIRVKVKCGCRLPCGVRSQTTRAAMQKIGLRARRMWMDLSSQIFRDEWRWLLWSWASKCVDVWGATASILLSEGTF